MTVRGAQNFNSTVISLTLRGISADEGNKDGLTPIIIACQMGRHLNVELLLKKARGILLSFHITIYVMYLDYVVSIEIYIVYVLEIFCNVQCRA